jgi:hypothetical protein
MRRTNAFIQQHVGGDGGGAVEEWITTALSRLQAKRKGQ